MVFFVRSASLALVGCPLSESSESPAGAAFFGLWEFSVGPCGVESCLVTGSRGSEVPLAGPLVDFLGCAGAA